MSTAPAPAPEPFEIRALATRDSLAQLTDMLHRAYAPLAAQGMNLSAATQTEDRTRERTLSGQTYVALRGRELVGTITVGSPLEVVTGSRGDGVAQYREGNCCRFHQFAIDPSVRNQGLAQALLRMAEEWALAQGYVAMATDMADGATELTGFYRHMGYRAVAQHQWPDKHYLSKVYRKDLHQSPLRAPLLSLARHHGWSTTRLLGAVALLSEADYRRPPSAGAASVHLRLNHLLGHERDLWWQRMGPAYSQAALPAAEVEPDRQLLAQQLEETAVGWQGLIDSWSTEKLNGHLRYEPLPGEPEILSLAEAVLHVFNCAAHQRGQVCAALTAAGHQAPDLDLVLMLHQGAAS